MAFGEVRLPYSRLRVQDRGWGKLGTGNYKQVSSGFFVFFLGSNARYGVGTREAQDWRGDSGCCASGIGLFQEGKCIGLGWGLEGRSLRVRSGGRCSEGKDWLCFDACAFL